MACISKAWCPQCEQLIYDSICMCACVGVVMEKYARRLFQLHY